MTFRQNVVSPSWTGFDDIKFLFVFGDSYSAVGAPQNPIATKDAPLGVRFPGCTYNEPGEPNWVGYLAANYHPILVYDYAVGGSTIHGVCSQIQTQFLKSAGQKPSWAPWDAFNSLFVTWIGVNDCAFRGSYSKEEFEKYQDSLFEQQEALYLTGARNFLFIDVPPMNKSPAHRAFSRSKPDKQQSAFVNWNTALYSQIAKFSGVHPDITILLFSSYDTFTRVFENPSAHGFNASKALDAGGPIWFDRLHPTSGMHAIIARELAQFLASQLPTTYPNPAHSSPEVWTSMAVRIGLDWPGLVGLKHLVIFGASYCDVGYNRKSPHPTLEQPLGVPYPGQTWAERGSANWVGHLITRLKARGTKVLVYDFARGGDTVDGIERQIHKEFLPELALQPEWAPWTASNTLFLIWVGMNDCALMANASDRVPARLTRLFTRMNTLCDTGAQNFMFIDLPPMNRSPSGIQMTKTEGRRYTFEDWNDTLRLSAAQFADDHPGVTVFIYSSHATFTRVLDDPNAYGFRIEDIQKKGGTIWYDQSHPSSKMHDEIAKDMVSFLSGVTRTSLVAS